MKHLKGLTLVSATTDQSVVFLPKDAVARRRRTSEDVPFEVFIPRKGLAAVGAENHCCFRLRGMERSTVLTMVVGRTQGCVAVAEMSEK